MWQIGSYISAMTRGLFPLSHCFFCVAISYQVLLKGEKSVVKGEKSVVKGKKVISEILVQDYRKDHAQEK